MRGLKREEGQSVVMVTFALLALIALVALVLDIGNAYAQRRVAQNAADAAAMAATRELARGVQVTTNRLVLAAAREYAERNRIDPATVNARYFRFNPDTRQMTDLGAVPNTSTRPPADASGVTVTVGKTFNTYLAHMIGHDVLTAGAQSYGQVSRGACTAGRGTGLFPIAVNIALFDNPRDLGKPTVGATYRIWEKDGGNSAPPPGNFGWLRWRNQNSANTVLIDNMNDTNRSGEWSIGDNVGGATGVMGSNGVRNALNVRIGGADEFRPKTVLLPIYDQTSGTGSNATYRIAGFAWFALTAYNSQGNPKWIEGYFIEDAVPTTEGGCMDFGTKTVKLRPPMDLRRTIAGSVAYEYLKINQPSGQTTYPVDVMNVLDVSGSMRDTWGSGGSAEQKLATAKRVLVAFNNMLRPDVGDQTGLVRYPGSPTYQSSSSYRLACNTQSSWTQTINVQLVQNLTADIALVNSRINALNADGGTPIASAMKIATEALLDPQYHKANHIPIILLASDGMANFGLDNRWTGWAGSGGAEPGCNTPASADAINMANVAKSAGVTVFTIAFGNDFLTHVLSAMASPDSNPAYPHFLQGSNPAAMQQIYASLGERIVNFGGECTITPQDRAANQAQVTLYRNGAQVAQTWTDSAGNFAFSNVQPGTYQLSATVTRDGLTYSVLTNKVGGYQLSSPPTVVVGEAAGTYSLHLSLKTNNPPQCSSGL